MKISCITLLLLLIFSCCEPKEDIKNLTYYDFDITIDPPNAGYVEVYDMSNNTLIESTDSMLEGTKIKLKAIPNAGFTFSGFWNNERFIPEDEPILIIQRNNAVRATFRTQSGSPVTTYGQLGIDGAKLVDVNGRPIQLRGMSLFWSQWIGKYYNANVVDWLANDWEANIIRASMGVDASGGYIFNRTEKKKVETVVDAAIETGVYVLIDWHSHHAEDYTDDAVAFFSEMAKKYGDYPNVIYEIYNEPLAVSWSLVLKPYAEKVIAAIRKEDPDNIIVVGTPNWSQNVDDVIGNEIAGDHIAYTFHFYASETSHHVNLFNKATKAINAGIPLFVTEWGVSEASGTGNFNRTWTEEWLSFMDEHQLSWCNWSVADKAETSAALNPGANANGNWMSSELSASGKYIRDLLLKHKGFSAPQ